MTRFSEPQGRLEMFDQLSDYKLLEKDHAPRSYVLTWDPEDYFSITDEITWI
jgi:hypothetical protein